MADFRINKVNGEEIRTILVPKESATVLVAGRMVGFTGGYAVVPDASTAKLAFCEKGAAAGETVAEITVGNNFTLRGTGDANFTGTSHRGAEVDMVLSSATQLIDVGSSSTDVFQISPSQDAGTDGATTNIEIKINKPIF